MKIRSNTRLASHERRLENLAMIIKTFLPPDARKTVRIVGYMIEVPASNHPEETWGVRLMSETDETIYVDHGELFKAGEKVEDEDFSFDTFGGDADLEELALAVAWHWADVQP